SATLSAIFAIIAGAVAIGWHETVVLKLLGGQYADQASGMIVCALFAGVYIALRLVADKFIPGAVLVPVVVDKVGGGVMGLIAGLVAGGIIAFAAQSLPFGPSIGGYARLPLADLRSVIIPPAVGARQDRDSAVFD